MSITRKACIGGPNEDAALYVTLCASLLRDLSALAKCNSWQSDGRQWDHGEVTHPEMALVRSSRYSSRRSTNRAHNNTSTLQFLSLLQGTQTDRAGPPRCLRCATPSPGALTRSDRNLKHARNGASWRSTRQASHSTLSVQLVANKTHTGLLPPRERLQPEESQARGPLLQSQRAQPR